VLCLQIFGKRLRVQTDGTKILKVLLDPNAATQLEYKLDAFATVYKKLTNKDAVFEFPVVPQE
jgi:small subunit ribosomal protein S7e